MDEAEVKEIAAAMKGSIDAIRGLLNGDRVKPTNLRRQIRRNLAALEILGQEINQTTGE
jgi:hypothetical protein